MVYTLAVYLHLLAALLWLGGMFFLALVGAPVLRSLDPPELRVRLFHELGVRFRSVGWGAIGVLIVTGLLILHERGVLSVTVLGSAEFWSTPFGRALAWKLVAVAVMVGVSALHDFVFGPRAGRGVVEDGSPPDPILRERHRRRALLLARLNGLAGLILVFWAMRLARGG